jgi:hypothetical protein
VFNSEDEAQDAINLINQGEGVPINLEAVTRTYTTVKIYEETIYIQADEVTEKYLGIPTDLVIEYTIL